MIETILKTREGIPTNIYPCLRINKRGSLVLFTSPNTGTILEPGSAGYIVGYFSAEWVEKDFKDYIGEICLFNR